VFMAVRSRIEKFYRLHLGRPRVQAKENIT